MSGGAITKIPKGLHHLESVAKNKFTFKYPSRSPHPSTYYVKPKDRIARWNVVPGDKVRLMVGKDKEKFNNEKDGLESGYKVYTVHSIDMTRNRLYLNGLTNKKHNPIQPIPKDFEQRSAEEQKQYTEQKNFIASRRAVQYSNVQLCVEDKGPNSVFATRICTSKPHFDKNARRYKWARFAANLSVGETSVEPNVRNGRIQIPWPAAEARKDTNPTAVDTLEKDATSPTLEVCEPTSIPPSLVPQSLRAPPPTNQAYSDKYVFSPEARASATLQAAMPLYLGEELSPRFSRAKLTKGWTARREMEAAARDHHAAAAVAEWEAGGRDAGLEDLLALPAVNLEGVTIRSRTRREVRDAAGVQFDKELAQNRSQVKANAASGARFNHVTGVTHQGAKGIRAIRKRIRKARKQEKITHRLQRLTLSGAKNQVIPADVHAN